MEAYKSTCKACGAAYFWTGYKTGLGKTPEQLARMRRDETVCRECGSDGLKTELDRESELGQEMDEIYQAQASMIGEILGAMMKKRNE